ncbi:MAG: hypothetical protein AB7D06_08515 [Pedobacter sp.]
MSLDWVIDAKDWIFSGAGTVLVVSASSYFLKFLRRRALKATKNKVEQQISKPTNSMDTYFKYSLVAKQSLKILNITQDDIDELIKSQYKAHPLLISLNYLSLPIPLNTRLHIIVSKQDTNCTIEDIRTAISEESILTAWTDLRNAYFKAYNLQFRHDHTILLNRRELKHTFKIIEELFLAAQEFYAVRSATLKTDERCRLHDLKNSCNRAILALQILDYSDDLNLEIGKMAIMVEMAISAIHKILLDRMLSVESGFVGAGPS